MRTVERGDGDRADSPVEVKNAQRKKKQLKEQCTQRDKHECTMNIAGSLIEQNVSYSKSPALNKTKV